MRRLVVCCDGTWKTADDHAISNVVKMMDAIVPAARRPDATGAMSVVSQVSWYSRGVGSAGNFIDRIFGGAFGEGLELNIRDAYRFLVQNYEPGDEIFLFGFSRGAYTARSLSGMIRCSGLVTKENARQIKRAYEIYRRPHPDGADKPDAVAFREQYSHPGLRIKFIGVWDTVGALGIPIGRFARMITRNRYGFHDTKLSGMIDNAYHALAIDEPRYTFEHSLWKGLPKDKQRVEQMWFAGAHSDVGGGYEETGLSDIAFQWMAEKAASCGLVLSTDFLSDRTKINPDPSQPPHDPRPFRLLPGNLRDIARYPGWTTESVHPTALAKLKDPRYAPLNLVNYTQRKEASVKVTPAPSWIAQDGDFIAEPPLLDRPFVVNVLRGVLGANAVDERRADAAVRQARVALGGRRS